MIAHYLTLLLWFKDPTAWKQTLYMYKYNQSVMSYLVKNKTKVVNVHKLPQQVKVIQIEYRIN